MTCCKHRSEDGPSAHHSFLLDACCDLAPVCYFFCRVPPLQPACCYWHKGLHTYYPKVDTQKHPQHSRNKQDNYENTGRRYVGSLQIQTQPQTSSEQVMIERDYFCIILFFFFKRGAGNNQNTLIKSSQRPAADIRLLQISAVGRCLIIQSSNSVNKNH